MKLPDKKFKSDGCSGNFSKGWKMIFKVLPPFENCCYEHDIEYHYGSGENATFVENFKERLEVDINFFKCIWNNSTCGKFCSVPMFLAVRLFGGAYWPSSYRWGFGWNKGD